MPRGWRGREPTGVSARGGPGGGVESHPPRSQGFVDYERVAARYRQGRSLPDEVLDRWGRAVRPHLRPGHSRVLDVGAGTGIFAKAWPGWTSATVVAVEPSAAMARAGGVADPAVHYVRGLAEALPLRAASVDVVWVSTALHHFGDADRSVDEFGRVLGEDGRVLVRTYLPGRTTVSWADEFPGRSKWVARFQTFEQLVALFSDHGFVLLDATDVLEWSETYDESAKWVEQMRSADSMLTALSDEEIAAGLKALRSTPAKIGRSELTLLVFRPYQSRPRSSSVSRLLA